MKEKIEKFNTPWSLSKQEIESLKQISQFDPENIKQLIKSNSSLLQSIESEIGSSLFDKNAAGVETYESYKKICEGLGYPPKPLHELENIYNKQFSVLVKNVENKLGGKEKAMLILDKRHKNNNNLGIEGLKEIQNKLGIIPTGNYDYSTFLAILRFQYINKLSVDGYVSKPKSGSRLYGQTFQKLVEFTTESNDGISYDRESKDNEVQNLSDGITTEHIQEPSNDGLPENDDPNNQKKSTQPSDQLVKESIVSKRVEQIIAKNGGVNKMYQWQIKNGGELLLNQIKIFLGMDLNVNYDESFIENIVKFQEKYGWSDGLIGPNQKTISLLKKTALEAIENTFKTDPKLTSYGELIKDLGYDYLLNIILNSKNLPKDFRLYSGEGILSSTVVDIFVSYLSKMNNRLDNDSLNKANIRYLDEENIISSNFLIPITDFHTNISTNLEMCYEVDYRRKSKAQEMFGLGNLMPKGVSKLVVLDSFGNEIIGERNGIGGEFFDPKGDIVEINNGDKIKVIQLMPNEYVENKQLLSQNFFDALKKNDTFNELVKPIPHPKLNQSLETIYKKYGSKQDALIRLQDINKNFGLENLKYLQVAINVEPTGIFDENTMIGLVDFQLKNGLKNIDGIIGPNTFKMIQKSPRYQRLMQSDNSVIEETTQTREVYLQQLIQKCVESNLDPFISISFWHTKGDRLMDSDDDNYEKMILFIRELQINQNLFQKIFEQSAYDGNKELKPLYLIFMVDSLGGIDKSNITGFVNNMLSVYSSISGKKLDWDDISKSLNEYETILEEKMSSIFEEVGVSKKSIISNQFERSITGTTLCGKTAKNNWFRYTGNNLPTGHAIDLFANNGLLPGPRIHGSNVIEYLKEQYLQMGDNFFFLACGKNGNNRGIKNGHTFIAFLGKDGNVYAIDPYYYPGRSQKPHLLSQHPLIVQANNGKNHNFAIHSGRGKFN